MTKRKPDAFLSNRRPLKQATIKAPKRKMPKKGVKVKLLYNANDVNDADLARRAMATLERWGYLCELIKE